MEWIIAISLISIFICLIIYIGKKSLNELKYINYVRSKYDHYKVTEEFDLQQFNIPKDKNFRLFKIELLKQKKIKVNDTKLYCLFYVLVDYNKIDIDYKFQRDVSFEKRHFIILYSDEYDSYKYFNDCYDMEWHLHNAWFTYVSSFDTEVLTLEQNIGIWRDKVKQKLKGNK